MADPEIDALLALADDLVARARRGGADTAEAVARSGFELSVRVRLGEPELVEEAGYRAVGMRVIKGQRVALTATSDLTPAGLERFVRDALELAELSQEDPFAGPADPAEILRDPPPELDLFDPSIGSIDAGAAITLARTAEQAARDFDARITNTEGATMGRTSGAVAIALSGGFRGGYRGSFGSLSVVPLADDEGGKKRRGHYFTAKRYLADMEDAVEVGREAARRTLQKLGARKVPTCEVPVVFHPDAGRSILGAFAGCAMASSIWRKSSYLAEREGTQVASSLVSIVDDPLLPRAPGSRPFDGEGLPSRRNVLVEKGRLVTYLCDSYGARKLGRRSTGSASRGASGGVGVSTTNLMLEPGELGHDDIVRQTDRGLYVTEMMGFGFNPVTGDFSRGAAGFWIENGQLAFAVSEVTISQNLDALFQSIDLIGSDLDFRSSTVVPTFRVARMTIAGT